MSAAATPEPTRRRLFEIIGASVGAAAAYQAMTSLGLAAESPYRGPIRLDGDPKGASVLILGAGLAGMTAAIELERAGYEVQVLEYNARAGGRNWTMRGGDTLHRARRRDADLRLRRRPLSQSRPVAHSLPPPRAARLLPPLRRRARAVHPAQPQRLLHSADGLRRQAAAHPRDQGRFRRRRRRAPGQGDAQGRAGRGGDEGGPGNPARGAARRSARSTRTSATGPATAPAAHRGYAKDPGGGLGARAGRRRADRPARHPDLAPVARPAELSCSTISRPPCSSRSAAWAGSARPSRGRSPTVIRYGAKVIADPPGRARRHGHLRGSRAPAARCRRRGPTGASARSRSPS